MKRVVLDASALMSFFHGRPGAEHVQDVIVAAAESKCELLMSVVNWGEVYYSIAHTDGQAVAGKKLEEIAQLPITVVVADCDLTLRAADLKIQYRLPYADCFAAALALTKRARLVTSDPDFKKLEERLRITLLAG